ncbi:hypothetical protein [Nocardioides ferulae]|uniref:hypothetical protein n=1 Tax=Nocardioides ferulae TaxID=2340821 RepID=UPI000EADF6BF|nr:hypothetical protein [Nocardioides ferulae]
MAVRPCRSAAQPPADAGEQCTVDDVTHHHAEQEGQEDRHHPGRVKPAGGRPGQEPDEPAVGRPGGASGELHRRGAGYLVRRGVDDGHVGEAVAVELCAHLAAAVRSDPAAQEEGARRQVGGTYGVVALGQHEEGTLCGAQPWGLASPERVEVGADGVEVALQVVQPRAHPDQGGVQGQVGVVLRYLDLADLVGSHEGEDLGQALAGHDQEAAAGAAGVGAAEHEAVPLERPQLGLEQSNYEPGRVVEHQRGHRQSQQLELGIGQRGQFRDEGLELAENVHVARQRVALLLERGEGTTQGLNLELERRDVDVGLVGIHESDVRASINH